MVYLILFMSSKHVLSQQIYTEKWAILQFQGVWWIHLCYMCNIYIQSMYVKIYLILGYLAYGFMLARMNCRFGMVATKSITVYTHLVRAKQVPIMGTCVSICMKSIHASTLLPTLKHLYIYLTWFAWINIISRRAQCVHW